jgi:hypothetical protein
MRNGYFFLLGFCFMVALMLPGCGSIAKEYVAADRATFDAVEPEYRKYVESDAALDDDAKALRLATLDSWGYRIKQAEKAGE